jgi:hypothetical protein
MDKKLLLGVWAIAWAGLLVGGWMMSSGNVGDKRIDQEQESTVNDEDKQKIENLVWDGWKDKEKYSFCLWEAKAETNYLDSLLGSKWDLSHNSKELLLWDNESRKLYIISREIIYHYDGQVNFQMWDMMVNVPVTEYGSLIEVYKKNEMPIRVDYYNNFIASNPDTKETTRVNSSIWEENEMVSVRMWCAGVYELGSQASALPSSNQGVSIQRDCAENDISGRYDWTFSFSCVMIDYDQAKNIFETNKIKEELQNTKDENIFEDLEEDELTQALSNSEWRDTNIDAQKKLQDLKLEMQADQRWE